MPHPEVFLTGLPFATLYGLLGAVATRVMQGLPIRDGAVWTDLFAHGVHAQFRAMTPR